MPCTDINGATVKNGSYFTPIGSVCKHCQCLAGYAYHCITENCEKPTCDNFEKIPGKCCSYTCPNPMPISDTKTLAIILSLSVLLFIILVLAVVLWRKTRKRKQYCQALQTVNTADHDTTTFSMPNNMREIAGPSSPTSSSSLNGKHDPPPYITHQHIDVVDQRRIMTVATSEPPPPYSPPGVSFV